MGRVAILTDTDPVRLERRVNERMGELEMDHRDVSVEIKSGDNGEIIAIIRFSNSVWSGGPS